jgi:hypothetical protein
MNNNHNLNIIEEEDFENKVTIRIVLEKFLTSKYGKYIEYMSGSLSFFSALLYIISTYLDEGISWEDPLDIVVMSLFLGEYTVRLIAA